MFQAEAVPSLQGAPSEAPAPGRPEESHWRRVELRGTTQGAETRGTTASGPHAGPTSSNQEELMIGLSLESERGSIKSQNDTDSETGAHSHHHHHHLEPHLRVGGSNFNNNNSSRIAPPAAVLNSGDRAGELSPRNNMNSAVASAVASWPPLSPTNVSPPRPNARSRSIGRDDSFYLPSSVASETESGDDHSDAPPPLPSSAPPGGLTPPTSPQRQRSTSQTSTTPVKGRSEGPQRSKSSSSVMGMTIKERISQIEQQLKVHKPSYLFFFFFFF